jgi:hypothetical protein
MVELKMRLEKRKGKGKARKKIRSGDVEKGTARYDGLELKSN